MAALLFALVLALAPGLLAEEEYYGSITRLEQCARKGNFPVKFNTLYMNYNGDTRYTLTFNITCTKELDDPLDMIFRVKRCATEHGPCEDFMNHTIENLCTELITDGSIPRSLFQMAGLPLRCPIPKGEYVTKNSEIKIHEELLMMGLYGNYWQFTLELTQRPDVALCLYIEGKVTKVKRLRKAKKQKKERKGHN